MAEGENPPEKLNAVIGDDEAGEQTVVLIQEAPGRYTGLVNVSKPGAFLMSLEDASGEEPPQPRRAPVLLCRIRRNTGYLPAARKP